MSILYSIAEVKNPQKPDEPAKYYARSQTRKEISTTKLVENIAWGTALTKAEVYGVVVTLLDQIKKHLLEGDSVNLMEFGKFRYRVSSEGAISREAFNSNYIKKVKVQFVPHPSFFPQDGQKEFELVVSLKEKEEALRQSKAK